MQAESLTECSSVQQKVAESTWIELSYWCYMQDRACLPATLKTGGWAEEVHELLDPALFIDLLVDTCKMEQGVYARISLIFKDESRRIGTFKLLIDKHGEFEQPVSINENRVRETLDMRG